MDSRSIRSGATTRGGVEFDDLAAEKVQPYYAFNLCKDGANELSDIRTAVEKLCWWLDTTVEYIECQSGKRISKFYIGKTYMHGCKGMKFDKDKPSTWLKKGIISRWGTHKNKDYGRSGMVVLTVITRDRVPKGVVEAFKHQQQYALALEQQLIMHYAFAKRDHRLANETINIGKKKADKGENEVTGAVGYPLYIAYALEDTCTPPELEEGAPLEIESDNNPNCQNESVCTPLPMASVIDLSGDNSDEERPRSPQCKGSRDKVTFYLDYRDICLDDDIS